MAAATRRPVALPFDEAVALVLSEAPRLLARALGTGGAWAELFFEHTTHTALVLKAAAHRRRRPTVGPAPVAGTTAGVGVRVQGVGGQARAATPHLAAGPLLAAAERAASRLRHAEPPTAPHPAAPFDAPGAGAWPLPPDAPDAIGVAEKQALLEAAVDAAFSLDARVRRVEAAYHDRVRRTLVVDSAGVCAPVAMPLLGLRVAVALESGGRVFTGVALEGGACGFGRFFVVRPEDVAARAVAQAAHRAAAVPPPTGALPVVLGPGWGGIWLHEALGHLLEADVVAAGGSPLAGRLGARVAPPGFTLADDPTLPGGRGTAPYDDEGTPTRRRVLIDDGVLAAFLTDRATPGADGGHARRQDFGQAPLPRMSNLVLGAGTTDPADLVASVADGLYVAVPGHARLDIHSHRFTLDVAEARRIEGGRLTAPLADLRLGAGALDAVAAVAGIGNDFRLETARGLCRKQGQVVPVSVGAPTVLLAALDVEPLPAP